MKRLFVLVLSASLVVGLLGVAEAKKKKPRKPVPVSVDQKYHLRRDACGTAADNTRLSLEDGPDSGCWASDAGIAYEVIQQAADAGVPFNPDVLWEPYPTTDGVPATLDMAKNITGELYLYGGSCITGPACSPAGISAGEATYRVRFIGLIGEERTVIGTYEETFTATPGSDYTIKVDIKPDAAAAGIVYDAFSLEVFKGGNAYGPGGISYDEPASFLTIPVMKLP